MNIVIPIASADNAEGAQQQEQERAKLKNFGKNLKHQDPKTAIDWESWHPKIEPRVQLPPPVLLSQEDMGVLSGSGLNVGSTDRFKFFAVPPRKKRPPHYYVEDVYMRQGRMLQTATAAEESVERLLLVFRLALGWLIDLLRPDQGVEKVPLYTIGSHYGSRRVLLEGPEGAKGQATVLYLQEMAAYDDQIEPFPLRVPGKTLADLKLELEPLARARTDGIVSKVAVFEIDLQARGSVRLEGHDEEIRFTLPKLAFIDPLREEGSTVNLEGEMLIECAARALSARVLFGPQCSVQGKVYRHLGSTRDKIATISGKWDASISAVSPSLGAAGIVYDASTVGGTAPKFSKVVNLRKLGPRYTPRVWPVLMDALLSLDPSLDASGSKGRQAAREARSALSDLTLRFEPLGVAPKVPLVGAPEDDDDLDDPEDPPPPPPDRLLPCIRAKKAAGQRLWWACWYRVLDQQREERDFLLHQPVPWVPEGADWGPPLISRLIKEAEAAAAQRAKGRR